MWLTCLVTLLAVISSEAKNILLRHFYQRAEDKVRVNHCPHNTVKVYWEREREFPFSTPHLLSVCSWDQRELRLNFWHPNTEASIPGPRLLLQKRLPAELSCCCLKISRVEFYWMSLWIFPSSCYRFVFFTSRKGTCVLIVHFTCINSSCSPSRFQVLA